MEKNGCTRCQPIVDTLSRQEHSLTPEQSRKQKLRTLEGMETLFLKGGCDKIGMICLPLVRLERRTFKDIPTVDTSE
jgi:hypothetical protein